MSKAYDPDAPKPHKIVNQLQGVEEVDGAAEEVYADVLFAMSQAPYIVSDPGSLQVSQKYHAAYGPVEKTPSHDQRLKAFNEQREELLEDLSQTLTWCTTDRELPAITMYAANMLEQLDDDEGDALYHNGTDILQNIADDGVDGLIDKRYAAPADD